MSRLMFTIATPRMYESHGHKKYDCEFATMQN